jgi:hypothetical protein
MYLLASAYHTVCVMGLLCAASLRPGRTPPGDIPRNALAGGSAGLILPFLMDDGKRPHWWDVLDQLDGAQRDSMAELLLNVAIRRKVRTRAFGEVHKVLELGYAVGLADTPASRQAAELLERFATFAKGVQTQ